MNDSVNRYVYTGVVNINTGTGVYNVAWPRCAVSKVESAQKACSWYPLTQGVYIRPLRSQ